MSREIIVNAIRFTQGGRTCYLAVATSDVLAKCPVPRYNPKLSVRDKRQGFQRSLDEICKRARLVVAYFSHVIGTICIPLVLNDRLGNVKFTPIGKPDGCSQVGFLTLNLDSLPEVVDGQTRQHGTSKVSDYVVPFMLTSEQDVEKVGQIFYDINATATRVGKELTSTWALRAAKEHGMEVFADAPNSERKKLDAVGMEAVFILNRRATSPLSGLFIMANQRKMLRKEELRVPERIITIRAFVDSMIKDNAIKNAENAGVLSIEDCVDESGEKLANLLDVFWGGVKNLLPMCFENPLYYNLTTAVGVYILHKALSRLIVVMDGDQLGDSASFEKALKKTGKFNMVNVKEVWGRGSKKDDIPPGEIAQYGSSMGVAGNWFRRNIQPHLPKKEKTV